MRELFGKICILVLRGGFVLVGRLEPTEDALFIALRGASVVREWGTTRGLGQLAADGVQPSTKLDHEGDVVVGRLEISRVIPCNESRWA